MAACQRMVAELIDHIEVYHAEKQDGVTNQRVVIFTITASVPLMCRIAGRSRRPTLSWKQEKAQHSATPRNALQYEFCGK